MKLCEACGSPLWSGHVCPRRAISDRMPVIDYGPGLAADLYAIWCQKRAVEKAMELMR